MASLKNVVRSVKNVALQYSDGEKAVRDCTTNDPWPASSTQMFNAVQYTENNNPEYPYMFGALWKRMLDTDHILHVKKSLILVDYLVRNASPRFVRDVIKRKNDIASLARYRHFNKDGEDDAGECRSKAAALVKLLDDLPKLKEARNTASRVKGVKDQAISSSGSRSQIPQSVYAPQQYNSQLQQQRRNSDEHKSKHKHRDKDKDKDKDKDVDSKEAKQDLSSVVKLAVASCASSLHSLMHTADAASTPLKSAGSVYVAMLDMVQTAFSELEREDALSTLRMTIASLFNMIRANKTWARDHESTTWQCLFQLSAACSKLLLFKHFRAVGAGKVEKVFIEVLDRNLVDSWCSLLDEFKFEKMDPASEVTTTSRAAVKILKKRGLRLVTDWAKVKSEVCTPAAPEHEQSLRHLLSRLKLTRAAIVTDDDNDTRSSEQDF